MKVRSILKLKIKRNLYLFIQRLYLAGLDGGYWGAMGVRGAVREKIKKQWRHQAKWVYEDVYRVQCGTRGWTFYAMKKSVPDWVPADADDFAPQATTTRPMTKLGCCTISQSICASRESTTKRKEKPGRRKRGILLQQRRQSQEAIGL